MRQERLVTEEQKAEAINGLATLLSEQQAAAFLGVSRITVLRMRQAGRIKFYRIGTRVLFDPDKHLREFLATVERNGSK